MWMNKKKLYFLRLNSGIFEIFGQTFGKWKQQLELPNYIIWIVFLLQKFEILKWRSCYDGQNGIASPLMKCLGFTLWYCVAVIFFVNLRYNIGTCISSLFNHDVLSTFYVTKLKLHFKIWVDSRTRKILKVFFALPISSI